MTVTYKTINYICDEFTLVKYGLTKVQV